MSYTKHTWIDDELITADKLNNIENGIAENGSSSGELATGNLQDGDILTVQATNGKVRKLKYTEVEVGIQYVKESESVDLTQLQELIGDSEQISTLYKLLDIDCIKYIKVDSGNISKSLINYSGSLNDSTLIGSILLDSTGDTLVYMINKSENKGIIAPASGHLTDNLNFSIVCKGFLPIE